MPHLPVTTDLIAQAIECANDAVIITSPELDEPGPRIEYVNPAFSKMTGYSREEVIGRTPRLLQGEKTPRALLDCLRAALIRDQRFSAETINYRKDGSPYWVEWRITPLKNPLGDVVKWVAVQRDTTERHKLLETREMLAAIVDSSADAIIGADLDGYVTSWNPAAERIFGFSGADVIGKNIRVIVAPDCVDTNDDALIRLRRGERVPPFETVYISIHGARIEVSLTISPIQNEPGVIIGISIIARDISETRELDRAREQLLEQERALRIDAERANRVKNEFLATLSHELRTPLTAILGWAQILRTGNLGPSEIRNAADIIYRNTRTQNQLIDDLLDMNQILAGKLHLDFQDIEVAPVLEAAVQAVTPSATAKNIRITTGISPAANTLWADPTRLQQIVWNLLANAVKFTPPGGLITLSATREDLNTVITVCDTGIGIIADFLPNVFARFVQADSSTTRRHSGIGLGLAIVKNLTEAHGGTVEARSDGEGCGATFIVRLPSATGGQTHGTKPAGQARSQPDQGAPRAGGIDLSLVRVLVVDDDPDTCNVVARVLGERNAHVTKACSAQEVLTLDLAGFDVLIADIGMPEMDGLELIRTIRAMRSDKIKNLPAIALTAFGHSSDRQCALESGFDVFVRKPVDPAELAEIVHRCWQQRHAEAG